MNEALDLTFALLTGLFLGAFFFGALWWTVYKGVSSNRPAIWFFGSMMLRTSIVLAGFYFILGDNSLSLLSGLLGFIVARLFTARLARMPTGLLLNVKLAQRFVRPRLRGDGVRETGMPVRETDHAP